MNKMEVVLNRYRRYRDYDVWQKSMKYNIKCEKAARQNPISVAEVFPSVESPRLFVMWGEFGVKILVENSSDADREESWDDIIEIDLGFPEAEMLAKTLKNRAKLGNVAFRSFLRQDSQKVKKEEEKSNGKD